ncbi:uncharacterized protein FN964_006957 isoform 1-T1 [Alca torda]
MRRREQLPDSPGSPGRPDLLRHEEPPLSSLYRSFFEEECRAIVGRLRLGTAAAEPSPGPWECSSPWPDGTGFLTSTPLGSSPPLAEGTPARAGTAGCQPAAAPGPALEEPLRIPGCPATAPPAAPPAALPRKAARRDAGQQSRDRPGPAGRPTTSARSPGRGGGRVSLIRARAGGGAPELPRAGKALGAPGTRPPRSPGTRTKVTEAARPRLQRPREASQPARPSAIPKAAPRDAGRGEAAAKAGGRRESSQRLPTAIPTVASRSRLRPLGKAASPKCFCPGSPTQKLICNRTWELKEDSESKEGLVAAGSVLGAGEQYRGPTPGWGAGACSPIERSPSGAFLAPDCQRPAENQASAECTAVRRVYVSALGSGGFSPRVGVSMGKLPVGQCRSPAGSSPNMAPGVLQPALGHAAFPRHCSWDSPALLGRAHSEQEPGAAGS